MYVCRMAVSVGQSELRIFILRHLDWDSRDGMGREEGGGRRVQDGEHMYTCADSL